MTVYIESNFVLEIALGQRHAAAAESILALAQEGTVELAIPSSALFEPFTRMMRQRERRRELRNRVNEEIGVLKRSRPHEDDVQGLTEVEALFGNIEDREKKRLDETVKRLIVMATVVKVDARVYHEAFEYERELGFKKLTDAIICAAILRRLTESGRPGPHLFATRDNDFRSSDIVERFRSHDCVIVFSFEECAQRLRINTSP